MANILALDDNLELCKLIRTALERDGHRVETRQTGGELTEALCRWADCILLDVMMPGEDGFAVCRRIRSLTEVPILFLSARTDEAAVLEGLGIGADDFLSKPFRVAELRARVAAHLRRQSRTPAHRMVRSGVAFDLTARSAAVEGAVLPLTRSEYATKGRHSEGIHHRPVLFQLRRARGQARPQKLEEKVAELLADTQLEENRLAAEVILYADKICTDEEVVRLKSHIQHMRATLEEKEGIGRKLDFIAQEMNREANTILSKANDIEVSNHAISLKTEIEKIREQIQNIE